MVSRSAAQIAWAWFRRKVPHVSRLGRWTRCRAPAVAADGAVAGGDAQLEQLAADALRAPQPVLFREPTDQVPRLRRQPGSSRWTSGAPPPEQPVGCVNSILGHRGSRGSELVRVCLPKAPRVGQARAAEGSRRPRVHAPSRSRLRRGAAPAFGGGGSRRLQDVSPVSAPRPRCSLPRWGIRPALRLGEGGLPTGRGHPQARHVSSGRGRTAPPRRPAVGLCLRP